jgi:hypothetical protein
MEDIECSGGITLEPRLQEYLNKRTYYKKNNIIPSISLENEYQITSTDIKLLKDFLKGDKNVYTQHNQSKYAKYTDNINMTDSSEYCNGMNYEDKNTFFASREFKNDPHYKLLQKKMQRDKDAMKQRNDYSSYTYMAPTVPIERNNYVEDAFDQPQFLDESKNIKVDNKYRINFQRKDTRTYHNEPKILYKEYPSLVQNNKVKEPVMIHDPKIDNLIGNLDSYSNHVNTNYHYKNEMDTENKIAIPNVNIKDKKYVNTSSYQPVPYMSSKEGLRDIGAESYVKTGIPSRDTSKKSYGYKNLAEHYFDYITDDIQDPDHVVMPFPRGGEPTRQDNTTTARARPKYVREILN